MLSANTKPPLTIHVERIEMDVKHRVEVINVVCAHCEWLDGDECHKRAPSSGKWCTVKPENFCGEFVPNEEAITKLHELHDRQPIWSLRGLMSRKFERW